LVDKIVVVIYGAELRSSESADQWYSGSGLIILFVTSSLHSSREVVVTTRERQSLRGGIKLMLDFEATSSAIDF